MEAKITRALESMQEKDLHHISQSSQTLQNAVENVQIVPESTQRDLQKLTVDLENQLGEHGHSQEGRPLSSRISWSTRKPFCELDLHTSSKWRWTGLLWAVRLLSRTNETPAC